MKGTCQGVNCIHARLQAVIEDMSSTLATLLANRQG